MSDSTGTAAFFAVVALFWSPPGSIRKADGTFLEIHFKKTRQMKYAQ